MIDLVLSDWPEYGKMFVSLLSLTNPVGAMPVFVSLTQNLSASERWRTAWLASVTALIVLTLALFTGAAVLSFFGITMASFRVVGGILILSTALSMLHARVSATVQTAVEAREAAERQAVAVVPLGIPILAGPGAIGTVIVYSNGAHQTADILVALLEISLVAGICGAALSASAFCTRLLGRVGLNIVTRIMGMFIAAVGVEFIADGLQILLPGLATGNR